MVRHLIAEQRAHFASGITKPAAYRRNQLLALKQAINDRRPAILTALAHDLRKPELESYIAELRAVLWEINHALNNLSQWVNPQSVNSGLLTFPATGAIYPEPLGVVLIISAWNYPFTLALLPLVGAIAAGNCAIIKPSESAPATSRLLAELVAATFPAGEIAVVEGDATVCRQLLAEKFDYLFFTGGAKIGREVMAAAATHLTPVTLELGGKSPCIVEPDIDLAETAKRIAWGKCLNAGQTCLAPDYLLVHEKVGQKLIAEIGQALQSFYGDDIAASADYGRIINEQHFCRLKRLLNMGEIIFGGQTNPLDRFIAPTLMANVPPESELMQDEIFGPLLPVVEYRELGEAIAFINGRPKPLALYLFTKSRAQQERIIHGTSSGGICINDTIFQVCSMDLPVGGVGESGMGRYRGKASFQTFSHYKSVLRRSFRCENSLRYPPYAAKAGWIKRFLG
jgi:acyl-CoA reductase-like NAD-dependent aldehyde dehydrogenase